MLSALTSVDHYGMTLAATTIISLSIALAVSLVFLVLIERPCISLDWLCRLWGEIRLAVNFHKCETRLSQ